MDNFTYCTPTKYIFGHQAEMNAGTELNALGINSVLLCYGGGSVVRSGLLDRVEGALSEAGIKFVKLGGIQYK